MFRVGLTEWFVLSAWCIWSLQHAVTGSNTTGLNGEWKWNSTGIQCRVMICTCYMNGVYYDEGDEWDDPDDPCVRYKCRLNGFYEPITSGCSFKGKCKDYKSTWTEGCFKYRCDLKGGVSSYRLTQTGCVGNNGQCLDVGQRYTDVCDTYECQIVGSCYTLTKIKTGCQSKNDGCMPIYSYWHDECAVYQCKLDRGNSRSTIQIHSHDVMLWPRGEYALLETKHGCPPVFKQFWEEGYHAHWGEGHNDFSDKYDLKGNRTDKMMEHFFCVHHKLNESSLLPVFHTYWEAGRYCIMAYNQSCPKGFKEGLISMLNQPTNSSNITYGTLPEGVFSNITTSIYFCCRYDGKIKKPIVLPSQHPFALYMAANESKCQEVKGMSYEIEYFSHDDTEDGAMRQMYGSLPSVKTGDNNTLIYVCYYFPLKCGCVDEEKFFVAMDDFYEKDCVKYQCTEIDKRRILVVVEGGCKVEDKIECVAENESWVEKHGEGCYTKQCLRKVNNETSKVTFVVDDILKECRDGDICRPLSYTKTHGCYSTQCQENHFTGETAFKVTEAACSDGHGRCVEVGEIIEVDCIHLKCEQEISKCSLVPAKGGCSFKGVCYEENSKWTSSCTNYTCINHTNQTHYQWKSHITNKGCIDHKGKCYREGARIVHNCLRYECIWDEQPGFHAVDGGCLWDGKCHEVNTQWTDGCSTYKCNVLENGTHSQRTVIPVYLGCNYDGVCHKLDVPFKIGCTQKVCRSCLVGRDMRYRVVSLKCTTSQGCYNINETFKIACSNYTCIEKNDHSCQRAVIKRTSWGCQDCITGQCMEPNETMEYRCIKFKCEVKISSKGFLTPKVNIISTGCDYMDICYKTDVPFKIGCTKKVCRSCLVGRDMKYRVVSLTCQTKGRCYDINETFKDGCSNFICMKKNDKSCQSPVIKRTSSGCQICFRGKCKCMEPDETMKYHCNTYKCEVKISSKGHFSYKVILVSTGCNYLGVCHKLDVPFKIGCTKKVCRSCLIGRDTQYRVVSLTCQTKGRCYDINETFKDGCSNFICTKKNDKSCQSPVIKRTSSGCQICFRSKCKCMEPDETMEYHCNTYKCEVKKSSKGHFSYKVILVSTGCKYDEVCHKLDVPFKIGCTKKVCRSYHVGRYMRYRVVSLTCQTKGQKKTRCYDINETFKVGCSIYRCMEKNDHSYQRAVMKRISWGCQNCFTGDCMEPDETMEYHCNTYKCEVKKTSKGHFTNKVILVSRGCKYDEVCHKLDVPFKIGCAKKVCRSYHVGRDMRYRVVSLTCQTKGPKKTRCYDINETFKVGCSIYRCMEKNDHSYQRAVMKRISWGCQNCFTGDCMEPDETMEYHCNTYKCEVKKTSKGHFTNKVILVSRGCKYNEVCHKLDVPFKIGCAKKVCRSYHVGRDMRYRVVSLTCQTKGPKKTRCYDINETFKVGCSIYRCMEKNDHSYQRAVMKRISWGCQNCFTGDCMEPDETMEYHCNTYKCEVKKTSKGHFTNKVILVSRGCKYDEVCHKLDVPFKIGCAKKVCRSYHVGRYMRYRVVSLTCQTKGQKKTRCYDINETFKVGCSIYRCMEKNDHSFQRAVMKRISWGCQNCFTGHCMEPDETMEHNCNTYKCEVKKTSKGRFSYKVNLISTGCEYDGVCHKKDVPFKIGCTKKVCRTYWVGRTLWHRVVTLTCQTKGQKKTRCYDINETFKVGCSIYRCMEKNDHSYQRAVMKRISWGCQNCFTGQCMEPDQTMEYNCNTYKCEVQKSSKGRFTYKVILVSTGCKYSGVCHKLDVPFKIGCTKKVCRSYHVAGYLRYKLVSLTCMMGERCYDINKTVKIGCSNYKCMEKSDHSCQRAAIKRTSTECSRNGKCYAVGTTLTDKSRDGQCTMHKCNHRGWFDFIKIMCKSPDGRCFEGGSAATWQKKYTKYNNVYQCTCRCKGNNRSILEDCYRCFRIE